MTVELVPLDASERLEFEALKARMRRAEVFLGDFLVQEAGRGGDLDAVTARLAEIIDCGAPVNHVRLQTALTNCCLKGNIPGVQLLLAASADPNQPNLKTEMPLHVLSNGGDPQIAVILLGAGAKLDVVDASGATPLEAAEMSANVPLTSVLRSAAARIAADAAVKSIEPRLSP